MSHSIRLTHKLWIPTAIAGVLLLFPAVWLRQSGFGFLLLAAAMTLVLSAVVMFIYENYLSRPAGIRNDGVWTGNLTRRGALAWLLALALTGFYTVLYFCPEEWLSGLSAVFDPLSGLLRGRPSDKWFVYGTVYTFSVVVMGLKFAFKYRHNRYQLLRTASVVSFQLGFAFLIPAFMQLMQQPEFYFTYFWPLKDYYGSPGAVQYYSHASSISIYFIGFSMAMAVIGAPLLTYFFGKRWYCSWVCGCGGLAETVGDPFRHLSDKSLKAWKFERWSIHTVLAAVTLMTALLWINSYRQGGLLGSFSQAYSSAYGYLIGMAFSGVVGVGFYPLMGSRVWCRFGCPQAAILGLFQRKTSKFRITVNGGQCISCGNCSTYCEMGIDVRHYAQRGQDVLRASCVGCGICAAVCPRGVLRLEGAESDIAVRASEARIV